jgi:hypothetical protein
MPFWGKPKPHAADAPDAAGQDRPAPTPAGFRNADDFRDALVGFRAALVGQSCTPHLVQAEQAFANEEYARALRCLQTAQTLYHQLHLRILNPDPRSAPGSKAEQQKLSASQEKIKSLLASFDRLIAHLEKVIKLNPEKPPAPVAQPQLAQPELPTGFKESFLAAVAGAAQLEVINGHFARKPANRPEDFRSGALYALQR